jgi:integrase
MTNDEIRKMKAGDKTLHDTPNHGGVRGLEVRIRGEEKVFYLYYRTRDGKQRRPKVGTWGKDFPLARAREVAREMLGEVLKGHDPQGQREASRAEMTIRELWEYTWENYYANPDYNMLESGWAKDAKGFWKNHLEPAFGSLKISELTPVAVEEWHSKYVKKGRTVANRSKEVLSRMYTMAETKGFAPRGTNPCALVKSHPERKRSVHATPEQLKAILRILNREEKKNPLSVAFIRLMLATGARPIAIRKARWDQLSTFEDGGKTYGILTFKGKTSEVTGEDDIVTLHPKAMAIIQKLPRIHGQELIVGLKKDPVKLWAKIRKEAGCEHVWLRDLRRTFASVGYSNTNAKPEHIGDLQGHKAAQTRMIYQRLQLKAKLSALDAVMESMNELEEA